MRYAVSNNTVENDRMHSVSASGLVHAQTHVGVHLHTHLYIHTNESRQTGRKGESREREKE